MRLGDVVDWAVMAAGVAVMVYIGVSEWNGHRHD